MPISLAFDCWQRNNNTNEKRKLDEYEEQEKEKKRGNFVHGFSLEKLYGKCDGEEER